MVGIIYESNFFLLISLIPTSYDQYHWCPVTLTVSTGSLISSIMYKMRSEGRAIIIRISPGTTVHVNSSIWDVEGEA